jgi:hypothetical protein
MLLAMTGEEVSPAPKRKYDCFESKKHCFLFLDPRFVVALRPRMTGEREK